MRSFIKIMLAAVLVTGAGYTLHAGTNRAYNKSAYNNEDRNVSGFNGVAVSGSFDVYIKQGSTESVKVEAPDDVIDRIVTEVEGGVLKIYTKKNNNWSWGTKKVVIHITAKNLNNITMSGSGDISFEGGIKANTLKLSVSGSGDISGKVDVQTLESRISGSGDISVSGRATNSSVSVTGSGDYDGANVKTVNTAVSVIGSGDASVNASTKVDASVTGSGDVHYTGGPKEVKKSKVGSGDISGS